MEAILQAGAEGLNCHAAGLYLLDEATTELKLRASWGLPGERLEAPARKLAGSMADLEALLGNAVVLTDDLLNDYWHPPEHFGAAICVPVASASQQLGTLWVFANDERDFSDRETNLLEVLAGSLACELERQVLADAALATRQQELSDTAAQQSALPCPNIAPLVDGWEIAGRASDSRYCGAWYDWFSTADGSLVATLGAAQQRGADGAVTAATVRSALRSQASRRQVSRLPEINSLLWNTSLGDMQASLMELTVADEASEVRLASAGMIRGLVINHRKFQSVNEPGEMLGTVEDSSAGKWIFDQGIPLAAGKMLVAYAIAAPQSVAFDDIMAFEAQLADALCTATRRTVDNVATIVHEMLAAQLGKSFREHAVLVIRRR